MKNEKVRVYFKGKGFVDVAKNVLTKILGNNAVKTFTLTALKKGAEVGGEKIGEVVANKLTSGLAKAPRVPLPVANNENEAIRSVLEQLEQKVKNDIENYNQIGKQIGSGYKIIK